jgi:hypothetical protein
VDELLGVVAEIVRSAPFWGFVGVLAGGLITGIVTIRAESIRADKVAALDSAKRQDDRQLKRDDIQRQTLLDLQEAVGAWMRVQMQIEHADVIAIRETGRFGRHGDELGAAQLSSTQRLVYLTERVKDDALRERLNNLRTLGMPFAPKDEAEVVAASRRLTTAGAATMEHLGSVLRTYL